MKKNFSLAKTAFAAALLLSTSASFTSCSNDDNPVTPGQEEVVDNGIKSAEELIQAINEAGAEATEIKLAADADIDITQQIDLSGKKIAIVGSDAETLANLTFSETGGFIINTNFKLQNVAIDASASTSPIVSLNAENTDVTNIDMVQFSNVLIVANKALFYSAAKNYDIQTLSIENCIIEQFGNNVTLDFAKGSIAENLIIQNSTAAGAVGEEGSATTKSFFSSQGGQKATELGEEKTEKFIFNNATFYNLAKGTKFFTHRTNGQTWLTYQLVGNIFVNCGKSGQVVMGVNGGQASDKPTWVVSGNVFNFDGADTSSQESTGDANEPVQNNIEAVVTFANPSVADFSQSNANAGDPRFIVTK